MPPFETMDRHQKAVLWPREGTDREGQPTVGDPVELNVRWVPVQRQVPRPDGTLLAIDAEVVVDRAIPEGSAMWLGALKDLSAAGLPDGDVMEVVSSFDTLDIKGRNTRHTVRLMRSKDVLPARA